MLNPSNSSNSIINENKQIINLTGLVEGDGSIIVPKTERSSKGN